MTARPDGIPLTLGIARVLLGLIGLVTLAGAVYFGFFAPVADGGVTTSVDWLIGIWSIAMSLAYLAAALMLRRPTRRLLLATVGLVLLHLVFGLVKLVGYNEGEAVMFFALDLLALGLLVPSLRSNRSQVSA